MIWKNIHCLQSLMCLVFIFCPVATGAQEPAKPDKAPIFYHGTAYYPELWPEANIDRDIAEMKKLGINVARMGEFAWSKMEPREGKINLDFFKRVMDKLHAAGIAIVLCTPTPTPPIWLTDGHPERCYVNSSGDIMIHGARQHVSYDHPDVQKASVRIVEAMAKTLGKHPGLVAWQIDNEFKCHVSEDFSDASVKRWRQWLRDKYQTIENLNQAWGTEIWSQRYLGFDQVPAPKKTPFLHNASLITNYLLFSREMIADFMDMQSTIIRRYSSAPITHNMGLGFSVHFERMSQNLDFVSFDDYPNIDQYREWIFDCDFFRSAKPGKAFWMMETSSSHNGWLGNHEPAHPKGFLAAEAAACYGLGGQAFNYWLWQQQRTGCELPHSAILSAWGKPGIGYDQVMDVEKMRRLLAPILQTSRPAAAQIAITWSDRGRAMLQTEALGGSRSNRVNYRDIMDTWHILLLDNGYHRDIRFEGASLDGLKILITPAMPYVSPAFRDRVKTWVENGGVWICGPLTGTRTAEHTVPTDSGLGLVDELAGVQTIFSYPITGTDAKGEAFGQSVPLAGWCSAVRPANPDTRSLGILKTELADGLSFITERKLGKGAVVLMTAEPQGNSKWPLLMKMMEQYAAQTGVTARYQVSKGTVVCPRISSDEKTIWIVVNMDGKGGSVQLPNEAQDALSGQKLPAGQLTLGRYEYRAVKW